MTAAVVTPGSASATSIAIPTHQIGDLILIWAYNNASTAVPTKPAAGGTVPAWVDIDAPAGANLNSARLAQFVATATTTTSGTWTGATGMAVVVIRGQNGTPIGDHGQGGGATSTDGGTAPALAAQQATDGSSIILHFFGHRMLTTWGSAPAGYTLQTSVASTGKVAVLSKNSSTSDGAVTMPATVSASGGYRGQSVEIRGPGPQTVSPTGLGSAQAFGAIQRNIKFGIVGVGTAQAFGTPTVTVSSSGTNVSVTGLGSAQSFGTITAAPGGVTKTVSGLGSAQAFGVPQENQRFTVAGLGSAQAFGSITTTKGPVTVPLAGLPSAQSFGSPSGSSGSAYNPAAQGGKHF